MYGCYIICHIHYLFIRYLFAGSRPTACGRFEMNTAMFKFSKIMIRVSQIVIVVAVCAIVYRLLIK